jgi:hypothetical protein
VETDRELAGQAETAPAMPGRVEILAFKVIF